MSTEHLLRQRVPSLAESTCSLLSETDDESTISTKETTTAATKSKQLERRKSSIVEVANSTFFRKRLSTQSSLPWGHRRSTMIGISCFLFLLPIPCLIKSCCPFAAFMLACVFVSSFSSDYLYSGVESWSHLFDRVLAPIAFLSNIYAVYSLFGIIWAFLSLVAVKCHLMAMYHSKRNNYDEFVIYHSLWHATGAGLILLSFAANKGAGYLISLGD
mmetsp:Transcript_21269/g.30452  ORF Transcript_21269/g.30452 Transcript_21269/m.30452 type:complete len:216 (-) Transcript_21269:105-752(-)|eukprot:CAMPEP_0201690974 /NCGR_PEP_ID=MMETSP0578-20130828/4256_1 /ASSEMBLY_ACC=CAM_ASM_000663 /TAXON_ID=267565 /ORGANISM="Skeletonema grethea, Strain CCMP 1804" /LENGTH=215 /DNA_ID=CAMNT_0048176077 /DNA_START=66 /DNA_END=713 /DNA_ORIENTATION=-